jgi:NAD(P)H-nitrite reductase large subunit
VTTAGGTRLTADLVLVGIGGVPSDQLARDAQLSCTNGIVVDDHGINQRSGYLCRRRLRQSLQRPCR